MSPPGLPPVVRDPLLLLDYDGTLAEIVADPAAAYPHPRAPALLATLSEHYPLYLVTGRRVRDLATLLRVPSLRAVGVHGMEEGTLAGEVRPLVDEGVLVALHQARAKLPVLEGVRLEDKTLAFALHYRGASTRAVETLKRWASGLPDTLDQLWGKAVLELRPTGYSKGQTALRLAHAHPEHTPLFIGDDTTDEEAFAVLPGGVTIKVGEGESQARYRLADVNAVIEYLLGYI